MPNFFISCLSCENVFSSLYYEVQKVPFYVILLQNRGRENNPTCGLRHFPHSRPLHVTQIHLLPVTLVPYTRFSPFSRCTTTLACIYAITVLPLREKSGIGLPQVDESKKGENGYKINHNIWKTKRNTLGEALDFDQSTKRNEASANSICAN
ncbi:hypothetical protein AVEN_204598-1 [Araneus ventricosus]|uniref:Uncharacterized protein n=1 Tax=Araneus ventricosus TaxID=182803 RepID=A0A4Y2RAM3_ARAVE|nr:hypothetical protein AVEN_204598-1 [Araneus ventricosus]